MGDVTAGALDGAMVRRPHSLGSVAPPPRRPIRPKGRFATEFQGVSGHCSPPAPASLDAQAKGWWACPRGGVRPLCAPVRCAIRRCSRTCLIAEVIGPTCPELPACHPTAAHLLPNPGVVSILTQRLVFLCTNLK